VCSTVPALPHCHQSQVEPRAAVRIGPVGHDREVLDLAAVGEQPALLPGDPTRQIAPRRRPVRGCDTLARHIRHLGPMADRVTVFPLHLPGALGQVADRRRQVAARIGTDRVADPLASSQRSKLCS
jgi:hypothetical protein